MTDLETLIWTSREILPLRQQDWLYKALDILTLDFQHIGETVPEGILIEVIDAENARVWFPQVKKSDGSKGSVSILTPKDIVAIGPEVQLEMILF